MLHILIHSISHSISRVLDTVKNYMVNEVFQICPMVEPNLCFQILNRVNVKIDNEIKI